MHASMKCAAIAAALTASSILLAPLNAQAAPALAGAKLAAPGPAVDSVHWRRCHHHRHHHHAWRHRSSTYGYAAPGGNNFDTFGYASPGYASSGYPSPGYGSTGYGSPMGYDYGTYGSAGNCVCGSYGSGPFGGQGLLGIGFLGL